MISIIEKQAIDFEKVWFRDGQIQSIEALKKDLDSKLLIFRRNEDRLSFFKTLLSETTNRLQKHEETCTKVNCTYSQVRNLGIFLISQEIDFIMENLPSGSAPDDKFSFNEEVSIINKLNEILDRLNKQDLGQEILFNEIDSLKNHFNLGKKVWYQLAIGKIASVTSDKILEDTIANDIISLINESLQKLPKLLS
ncbi:MAG: hypothetical protein WAT92_04145 [Saprospiraceae bacterium]